MKKSLSHLLCFVNSLSLYAWIYGWLNSCIESSWPYLSMYFATFTLFFPSWQENRLLKEKEFLFFHGDKFYLCKWSRSWRHFKLHPSGLCSVSWWSIALYDSVKRKHDTHSSYLRIRWRQERLIIIRHWRRSHRTRSASVFGNVFSNCCRETNIWNVLSCYLWFYRRETIFSFFNISQRIYCVYEMNEWVFFLFVSLTPADSPLCLKLSGETLRM